MTAKKICADCGCVLGTMCAACKKPIKRTWGCGLDKMAIDDEYISGLRRSNAVDFICYTLRVVIPLAAAAQRAVRELELERGGAI